MNETELWRIVAKKTGVPMADVRIVYHAIFQTIGQCLKKWKPYQIRNFGKFSYVTHKGRMMWNPAEGKLNVWRPDRVFVRFHLGGELKKAVRYSLENLKKGKK